MKDLFAIAEKIDLHPSNPDYAWHNHAGYEVYMFLEGKAQFLIEGNSYTLQPNDVIIVRKGQMHCIYHNSPTKYRRIVIHLSPDFFQKHNCEQYEEQFLKTNLGNKIDAQNIFASGIYDVFLRLRKYTDNFKDCDSPIAASLITELLYLTNSIKVFTEAMAEDDRLSKVIKYINVHYTENMSLDMLERDFYISKYHLCRTFRKVTGLTIHQYIMRKRITLIEELVKQNTSISDAAVAAGFASYSSFYRAYTSEYGHSPKEGLNNQSKL